MPHGVALKHLDGVAPVRAEAQFQARTVVRRLAGGGVGDVGGGARALGVDRGDAVVAGGPGGDGVGEGRVGIAGVGGQVPPAGAAIGGDLDPVAGDGEAAVAGRRGPGEVDPGVTAGRCHEAPGGGGHVDGGIVDDVGHAVDAGGEGGALVAEAVLQGNRVVACGGIGIGESDRLALGDDAGQAEGQPVGTGGGQPADRNAGAVGRDGEGRGQARQERERFGTVRGQGQVLVERQRDGVAGGADRGADERGPVGFHPRAYHRNR